MRVLSILLLSGHNDTVISDIFLIIYYKGYFISFCPYSVVLMVWSVWYQNRIVSLMYRVWLETFKGVYSNAGIYLAWLTISYSVISDSFQVPSIKSFWLQWHLTQLTQLNHSNASWLLLMSVLDQIKYTFDKLFIFLKQLTLFLLQVRRFLLIKSLKKLNTLASDTFSYQKHGLRWHLVGFGHFIKYETAIKRG